MNVSADPALRDTRYRLLSTAGFSVLSVNSAAAAEGILEAGRNIDAMVVCESIPAHDRKRLVRNAKGRGIPVVVIASVVPEPSERSEADATVPRLEDPSVFLSAVVNAIRATKPK